MVNVRIFTYDNSTIPGYVCSFSIDTQIASLSGFVVNENGSYNVIFSNKNVSLNRYNITELVLAAYEKQNN